jgi:translation initiation factor eIF-2B subunit epsilon
MAPQKNSKQDYKQQDVLQAVLVASGFVTDFGPLTLDAPHALLPLVNTPLIDYTLQLLVTSGVQEILVVASAFATEIKSHVDASMFSQSCRISYVISEGEFRDQAKNA